MKEHPKVKTNSARLADTRGKRRKVACDKHATTRHFLYNNKRGYSTEGSTLLPSVLRPRLFGIGIAVSIAAIIGVTLNASDNQASAVSATLSVPEGISVNANPSVNNGFVESSNGAISVSTGNQMGYTLTIKAKDNNQLKNGSNVLNSISTNLTADQYKTGDYVNTWGFKPSAINSESNTSYVPGPNSTTGITLASTHASSNDAENYSIGIAAKVDSNTVAGNYTNTFVMTATANEAKYTINYNLNGGSGGPSKATETGDIGSSTEIAVNSTAPTAPSGKDFLGWCSKNPGTSDTCDGVLVQPGKSLYLCKCDLNITLYAMYGKKINPNEGSFAGIKDGTACKTETGYTAKVYGEKCWMWKDYQVGSTKYWNWNDALTICPTGWHLPSKTEFQTLLDHIGSDAQLYRAGWTNSVYGNYWSSTEYESDTGRAHLLAVGASSAFIGYSDKANGDRSVRCVAG